MTLPKPVEEDILDRFETLMRHAAGSHAPEFLGVDVTMPQAKVLYLVSLQPDLPMSAIAARLGVGPPAVSGLVDRLVALGYVERREDPGDRRQQLISTTEACLRLSWRDTAWIVTRSLADVVAVEGIPTVTVTA